MTSLTTKSGKHITLRPPQAGDEQILYDFAHKLGSEDTFVLLNPHEPVTWEEEVAYLASILKKIELGIQVHYLAFHEDLLVASSQISTQGRRKHHVGSFGISILPQFRQDGLGSQLAGYVIAQAQETLKIKLITLEVFATNHIAQNLYQKLGFTEYGRLPHGLLHQNQLIDSIFMYKQISKV
jgi:RimJ/RimL family protein N-acetyltransferase